MAGVTMAPAPLMIICDGIDSSSVGDTAMSDQATGDDDGHARRGSLSTSPGSLTNSFVASGMPMKMAAMAWIGSAPANDEAALDLVEAEELFVEDRVERHEADERAGQERQGEEDAAQRPDLVARPPGLGERGRLVVEEGDLLGAASGPALVHAAARLGQEPQGGDHEEDGGDGEEDERCPPPEEVGEEAGAPRARRAGPRSLATRWVKKTVTRSLGS